MIIDKENFNTTNLVTVVPERELKSNEEIETLLMIREDNKFHIGFVLNVWESASQSTTTWIGAKLEEK